MSRRGYLLSRLAGLIFSVWVVFTASFLYFVVTPYTGDVGVSSEGGGPEGPEASSEVSIPASADDPLLEQYVDWLAWFVTVPDQSVTGPLFDALGFTAAYFVPALVVAVVLGTVVRTYTVASDSRFLDGGVDTAAVVGVCVPAFVFAFLFREFLLIDYLQFLGRLGVYNTSEGPFSTHNLTAAVWPGTAMVLFLLTAQLRYAGDQLHAYASDPFVKTARAKGLSTWRIGRHIYRNVAVTLVTALVTDLYGMVLVAVFTVEFVARTPGIGSLMVRAVLGTNLAFVLAVALPLVLVGVLANYLQDVAHLLFDPRVEVDDSQ